MNDLLTVALPEALARKIADYELMIRERQRFADHLDDLGETIRVEIVQLARQRAELENRHDLG